jgi:hypothetical protein
LKQRTGDPWMPAARYGRELTAFTVNLLVRDVPRAVGFYTKIFSATTHYVDPDFAAINVGGVEMMLHADHTYDKHPWYGPLTRGERRASAPSCACSASIPTPSSAGRARTAPR